MTSNDREDAWRSPRWAEVEPPPRRLGFAPFGEARVAGRPGEGAATHPDPPPPGRADDFLTLLESHGLSGAWSWHFDTDRHAWSPGCFRLLGLDPRTVRPSYALLLDLVHPEDRGVLPRPCDLARGEPGASPSVRVIRPDGTLRILAARSEVKLGPDGDPICALGTLLDVTDREQGLRAQVSLRRQTRALYRQARILWFAMLPDGTFDFEPEGADLLGCPPESLARDPFAAVEPGERAALYETLARRGAAPEEICRSATLRVPGEPPRPCRIVMFPPSDGPTARWTGLVQLTGGPEPEAPACGAGDDSLRGYHLRAARALLDWSMLDLAAASGLSLSTVRRLEADDDAQPARSRPRAAAALRDAGIRFMPLADGTIAVSQAP